MDSHKTVISVKEARKLLGKPAEALTDGELLEIIAQQEQVIRFIFRLNSVRKSTVVR